jgi:hypothetical protein
VAVAAIVTLQFRLGSPVLWYYEGEIFGYDSDNEINGGHDKFVQI